ncbi:MAG: type II secretion system protein [Patescibacteria group bacterium]
MQRWQQKNGFTLVETMIYVSIIAVFLVSVVFFALEIVQTSQRARIQLEVDQNIRFAMERMVREIRAADDVNTGSSTFGSHPGVLSIANDSLALDPTVFDVSSGALRLKYGSASALELTSDDVVVTNLVFTDFSRSNRTKNIRISMTIEYIKADAGKIYDVSSTRQTSVVIRERSD